MATISANINISSADITSSAINISNTMTMTKAGTNTGLDFSSGLISRKFTAVTEVDLVAAGTQMYGTPTATDNANKLYIKNTGSSTTEYVTIGIGTATETQEIDDDTSNNHIGRLYGGDWMLIPFHGVATNGDITVKPSTAEVTTVEWILFFQ